MRPSLSRQWLACSSSRVLIYANSVSPTSFSSNSIMCAGAGECLAEGEGDAAELCGNTASACHQAM